MLRFCFLFFFLAACFFSEAQTLSSRRPDKISVDSVTGDYTEFTLKIFAREKHFVFKSNGHFRQSHWPHRGTWEIINDTIYCHGKVPFYSIDRYMLHTDVIHWKMIKVNGLLFKIKKLLDGTEMRIETPYLREERR